MLASIPNAGLDPSGFVVRDVALDRNRDLVGRTLGDIADERNTTRRRPARRPRRSRRTSARGSCAPTSATTTPTRSARLLAHPYVHVGASDGGAHVGSFATYGDTGLPDVALRPRDGRAAARGGDQEDHVRPGDDLGSPADGGLLREGYVADVAVFDADTLDRGPEVASDDFPGDGIRWIRHSVGMDTVVVGGEVTWSAAEGYVAGARAGGLATR